jgi:hypothetical protein
LSAADFTLLTAVLNTDLDHKASARNPKSLQFFQRVNHA